MIVPRRWAPVLSALAVLIVVLAVWLSSSGMLASKDPLCSGNARCFHATVTSIVDGDTLDVGSDRIRLALVDTPELGEPGYEDASAFAASVCPVGQHALVDEDDGQTGGSHGRIVAVVYCPGGNLNARLLEAGHAILVTSFCAVSEFAHESWAAGC